MAVFCSTVAAAKTAKAAEQAAKPHPANTNAPQAAPLRAVFFHSSTCHECQVVSLLESLCTAQVYLPTIVFLARAPGMRTAAVAYLLLYNVMFILPLVGILAMTYFGVRSETLGNMLRKRLAFAKLGMAGLFAGLGVLVTMTVRYQVKHAAHRISSEKEYCYE